MLFSDWDENEVKALQAVWCEKTEECDFRFLKLLHARFQACQVLDAAMISQKTVNVGGFGQGSNIAEVVSVTMEEPSASDLESAF